MLHIKDLKKSEKLILSWLELDARMPFSRFGKRIRKSQQQISYTVNSMINKGLIQRFYTIIDYSKLNTLNFRVFFKVSYVDEKKIDTLIEYLIKDPHTSWIASCGGRYDLVVTFLATNPSQFNKTLKSVMAKFPQQLQNYTVLTTIVNREFGRKYLFRDPSLLQKPIFGGDRAPEDIDQTDMTILNCVSDDARMSSVIISQKADITPKTVIERIKKLKDRKIIRGFKPSLDARKAGYVSSLIMIKYHNVSTDIEDKLISYLKAHPNILNAVKTLGEWDIEIEVEVKEMAEFRKIEILLRNKFANLIQQIESIPLYNTHKLNFFPKFLLAERNVK